MRFFSGGRRGGGAASILPNASLRRRKPALRRRHPLPSLSMLLLTALLLSLLFLLLRFSLPHPNPSPRRPISIRSPRRSLTTPTGIGTAKVDLTTKDLYDRIQFLDVDGGAWKQGWDVRYKGHEWDVEKLKVFVVPHSHNDPGWKMTVEEYYEKQSRHILDTIVDALSKSPHRKFIWEEMSYLERWWRDAPNSKKEHFSKLVKNGQLEIVGGGWVMNDEANSHYFAIIEQMMAGNLWLNDTLGVIPKNAWAIDPFGYSSTMAYLLRRMGFPNMLIQRTHYELKKELALHQNLEYIWRQSWDEDETTDIFVHMMPFYSYDIPHTCGPEPAICCQFDFARMRGFSYEACPWRQDPVETNSDNVQERALKLLDQYKKKSTLYRTNTLLVPLGDDFRYISAEEADVQFRNYERLFDYINSNPSLHSEVKFGTLEDYFSTLREESVRINYSHPGETGSRELEGFPSLSGDFFTYADRNNDYWSGYYVSRPFFKAVDRILEQTLRASEMLAALVLGYCQKSQCSKLPFSFSRKIVTARRNLALFQHHDGVTGTARDHVVEDYGLRMHTSLHDLHILMSKSVEVLLGDYPIKSDPSLPSQFEPEQVRSKYDAQPMHKGLDVLEGNAFSVVFFNPLEQTRDEIVMIVVDKPDVCVLHSNRSSVNSQISPELQHDNKGKLFTGRHRLYWRVSVPAMGLETYYVGKGLRGCEKAQPSEMKVLSGADAIPCPSPYVCSKLTGEKAEIKNRRHSLLIDLKNGLVQKLRYKNGGEVSVKEEIGMYSSSGSGAYLFKPVGEARSIILGAGQLVISRGPFVQEVYSHPKTEWDKSPISHSTRIYSGEGTIQELLLEKEYHVEFLGDEFNNKELITRFKTSINNNRVFYSDLNGFQMSRRETYDKIPLQGNYYPMPSLAFLQNPEGWRFSVHSRQSLGAASLKNGWIEIMLDRRLVHDDGRGLGQGVMDNRPMNVVFHILAEHNVSNASSTPSSLPLQPSLLSHLVGANLNYPIHVFVSKEQREISHHPPSGSFSPLTSSLPCDLHVVSLKIPQPFKHMHAQPGDPRFAIMLQRRGWDSSYCKKGRVGCSTTRNKQVDLSNMFKDLTVLNAKATSLNLLHDDPEALGYIEQQGDVAQEGHLMISPMEIQAYIMDLQLREASSSW